ncbi:hypothetical protein ACIBI9_50600 [Nonomuraea sp. NPDC050451]|uniref:hypothetical protein n=1 Tax=Nonomuraea sp. NPDC050451 TaxID=3364364 RepID=UPI00378A86B5
MLREFGGGITGREVETGRTIAELLDAAAARRHVREQQEAARRAEEQARREQERRQYDQAVDLLRDLHALALRDEHTGAFTQRLTHLRKRHQGKPSLIKRLNDAGLTAE